MNCEPMSHDFLGGGRRERDLCRVEPPKIPPRLFRVTRRDVGKPKPHLPPRRSTDRPVIPETPDICLISRITKRGLGHAKPRTSLVA